MIIDDMTLILQGSDDQQVPGSCFDVINSDSGATVSIQKTASLPDLESLLSDLQGIADAEAEAEQLNKSSSSSTSTTTTSPDSSTGVNYEVPIQELMNAPLPDLSWDMEAHNEISFYEDYSMQLKHQTGGGAIIKTEMPPVCGEEYGGTSSHPPVPHMEEFPPCGLRAHHHQLPPVEDFFGGGPTAHQMVEGCVMHYDDGLYDATVRKIELACMTVSIHNDPFNWSVDEVRRWASWAVDQFSGLQHDFCELEKFEMDGTTLCMLTKDEFVRRSPIVGEYLYAELEIWKNTYTLQTAPVNPANVQSSPETDVSYLDLDELNHSTSSISSLSSYGSLPYLSHHHQGAPLSHQAPQHHLAAGAPSMVDMERVLPHPHTGVSSVSPAPSLDSTGSAGSWGTTSPQGVAEVKREVTTQEEQPPVYRPHPHGKQATHLWQFLKELLLQPQSFQNCIRWLNRAEGIFKIEDSARVAKLWGQRKNRPAMNYDKLSRSIRQYYKKGIIKKTTNSKRLVYQFCPQYM